MKAEEKDLMDALRILERYGVSAEFDPNSKIITVGIRNFSVDHNSPYSVTTWEGLVTKILFNEEMKSYKVFDLSVRKVGTGECGEEEFKSLEKLVEQLVIMYESKLPNTVMRGGV